MARTATMSWTRTHEWRGAEVEYDTTVEVSISGRHSPMRWGPDGGSPEEFPDIDILSVTVDATGEDITDELTSLEEDEIQGLAEDRFASDEDDAREAAAEDAWEARHDR